MENIEINEFKQINDQSYVTQFFFMVRKAQRHKKFQVVHKAHKHKILEHIEAQTQKCKFLVRIKFLGSLDFVGV